MNRGGSASLLYLRTIRLLGRLLSTLLTKRAVSALPKRTMTASTLVSFTGESVMVVASLSVEREELNGDE